MTTPMRRDISIQVDADVARFNRAMKSAQRSTEDLGKVLEREQAKIEAVQRRRAQAMDQVGRGMVAFGAAAAAGLALSARAAYQWESAWVGVTKTVEGNREQMAQLEDQLRSLARTLPASHTEIAAVAAAAGQLGVQRQNVAAFTKVMVDLGESTNLSADQAATGLARMMNIMQTAPQDVGRLGAALVELGNNGASTESEILEMSLRIASAGKQIGLSEAEVLGFANALSSVGIEAEAGGSSISRVFIETRNAVMGATPELEVFAEAAGMTGEEFARAFREDAGGAVISFIEGLGRMERQGRNSNDVLAELGLTDIRVGNALRAAAGAGDLFRTSLEDGNRAWRENTALVEEANKRYATTESQLKIARNAINDAGIEIGATLLPAIAKVADGVAGMAKTFADLPGPVKGIITALGTAAATIGLVGGGALIAAPKIIALRASLETLGMSAARADKTMKGLAVTMKTAGIAAAAVGIAIALDQVQDSLNDVDISAGQWAEGLADFAATGRATGEVANLLGRDFENLADTLDAANNNRFSLFDRRGLEEVERAREVLKSLDAAVAALYQSGHTQEAGRLFADIAEKAREAGYSTEDLADAFPAYTDALAAANAEQKLAADGTKAVGDAAAGAAGKVDELTEAQKALEQALGSFASPLSVYTELVREQAQAVADSTEDSADSWETYADRGIKSLDQLAERLEQDNQAHLNWQDNLVKIAQTAGTDVAQILAEMGEEGVQLTAQMANGTTAEVERMANALRTNAAQGGEAAARELDNKMKVMAAIAQSGGRLTVEQLAAQLEIGAGEVARIANQYGVRLAAGVNPILVAIGGRTVNVNQQPGRNYSGPRAYADGGVEDHVAQIAPAGAWRVWAEPETGGEAYIPLAPEKRARSVEIWRETGRRLQQFASGGFYREEDVPRPPRTSPPYGPPLSTGADATMGHLYGEALEFVKKNAAPPLAAGIGWQAMMAALRVRFPGLPLISGFRPGAITATGNASYHGMGRAVDIPPRMDVFNWIAQHYGNSRELIFSPAGGRQIHNGRPHMYTGVTRAMHFDHVHWAMAKGGILNPHVRDSGGPLLPGWTYNGTRRPEMVLPMADGGFYTPHRSPVPQAQALLASGGTPEMLRQLLVEWQRFVQEIDAANERLALTNELAWAQADLAGKTGDEWQRAYDRVVTAQERLASFDQAALRDAERRAVEELIDALEREARVREEAARTRDEAVDRARDALGDLNRLLDEQADVRRRMTEAQRQYQADQQRLLDARRRQLVEWVRLDERSAVSWGNSVEQLIANVREQAEQFAEWQRLLAQARSRGVSGSVIELLGLDAGPEALGQLRQFSQATQAEIDQLNQAVAARSAQAGQAVAREQAGGYGELGEDLTQLHAEYLEELKRLQQDMANIGADEGREFGRAVAEGMRSEIPAVRAAAMALMMAARQAVPASMVNGVYTDTVTGRAAFYGPNGEPGSGERTAYYSTPHVMPDGRVAYYHPGDFSYKDGRQATFDPIKFPAASGGGVQVRVFIGDRELTDIVKVQVGSSLTQARTATLVAGKR